MRRTVSFPTLVLSLILFTAGGTLGQQVVTHYNGGVPSPEGTASDWPTDDYVVEGGLKSVLIGINGNAQATMQNPSVIHLGGNLTGAAGGVNDNAFPTIASGKWVRITANGGNDREISAYPTSNYTNTAPAPTHLYIPLFSVASGARLDLGDGQGSLEISNGSRRDTSEGGGAVQVNGNLNILSTTTFLSNESNTNGGAIHIATGGVLNGDGSAWGVVTFDSNRASGAGGAVNAASGARAEFRSAVTFTNNWARVLGEKVGETESGWSSGAVGGAIAGDNANYVFRGVSTFESNKAGGNGGAAYMVNGSRLEIRSHSTFDGNKANFGSGGAIFLDGGSLLTNDNVVTLNTIFTNNQAYYTGGAIHAENGSDIRLNGGGLDSIIFQGNRSGANSDPNANGTYWWSGGNTHGGAISSTNSNVIFNNPNGRVQFLSNIATRGHGGGIYMSGQGKNLTFGGDGYGSREDAGTVFTGNIAGEHAGGYYGGAIHTSQTTVQFYFETYFNENHASGGGGAIYADRGTYSFGREVAFINNLAYHGGWVGDGGAIKGDSTRMVFHGEAFFGGNKSATGYNYDGQVLEWDGQPIPAGGYLAYNGGGAIAVSNGTNMTFESDVVLERNYGTYGGAILSDNSTFAFGYNENNTDNPTNVVFSKNNGVYGGAIRAENGSTFRFNSGLDNTAKEIRFEYNGDHSHWIPVDTDPDRDPITDPFDPYDEDEYYDPEFTIPTSRQGGAIASFNSTFNFTGKVVFYGNKTELDWNTGTVPTPNIAETAGGGAIYATDASTFTFNAGSGSGSRTTEFEANESYTAGGAIYADKKSVFNFDGATLFIDNAAARSTEGVFGGGAIFANDSTITFNGWENMITFEGNKVGTLSADGSTVIARGTGGAIYAFGDVDGESGSTITFAAQTPVRFAGNTATDTGGAVKADYGSTITFGGPAGPTNDSPTAGFYDNTAGRDGGAIIADHLSTLEFNDVATFEGNLAGYLFNETTQTGAFGTGSGGALRIMGGSTVTFKSNTTFKGNQAATGGGAVHISGDGTLDSNAGFSGSTIFRENTAHSGNGGAIIGSLGANVTIVGEAIFEGNTAEKGLGGAVYLDTTGGGDGKATLTLNPDVSGMEIVFQGNYDKTGRNAVHLQENAELILNPVAGASILFYDPISSQAGSRFGNTVNMLEGSGTVKLWNTSDYYGDTNIGSGRFVLAAAEGNNKAAAYGNNAFGTFSILEGGTLVMEAGTRLNAQQILFDGGTVEVNGTVNAFDAGTGGIVMTEKGGTINVKKDTEIKITQQISDLRSVASQGYGTLTKDGEGTLVFGDEQLYRGITDINAGTLRLDAADVLVNTSIVRLNGTSVLDLNDHDQQIRSMEGTSSSQIRLGSAQLTLDVDKSNTVMNNKEYAGVISGTGSVVKSNTGTLYLSGKNTFTGGATVSGGVLGIRNGNALGTGAVSIESAGTLELDIFSSVNGFFNNAVSGSGNLVKTGTGTINVTGTIDLSDAHDQRGNLTVKQGIFKVSNGARVNVDQIAIQSGGVLDVAVSGRVVNNSDVLVEDGGTVSVTVDAFGVMTEPLITSGNQIVIGKDTTLNLNIVNISDLEDQTLVFMHASEGIVSSETPYVPGSGVFSRTTVGGIKVDGTFNEDVYIVLATPNVAHEHVNCPVTTASNQTANDYVVTWGFAWVANNDLAHGTFNVTGSDPLLVDVSLLDQQENRGDGLTPLWDGKSLTKKGAGTMILARENGYTGDTTILGGTLEARHINALGLASDADKSVYNSGKLVFNLDETRPETFRQSIIGTGSLEKSGTGSMVLGGEQNYTGKTRISGGELALATSVASSAFTVDGNDAILSGTGKVYSLELKNGGTLALGRSGNTASTGTVDEQIGRLEVADSVKFGSDSVFDVHVTSDLQYDRLVAKSADLSGGSIRITPLVDEDGPGFTENQYVYEGIVSGALNGTKFGSRDLSLLETLGYTAELYYTDNKVSLVLVDGDYRFSGLSYGSYNVNTVGGGLDEIVENDTYRQYYRSLTQNIRSLGEMEGRQAIKDLSPDLIASGLMIAQWDVARPVLNRLNLDRNSLTNTPRDYQRLNNVWIDAIYENVNMLGDKNGREYGISRAGMVLGVDRRLSSTITAGLVFAYSNPTLKGCGDEIQAHDFQLGFYYGQNLINGFEFKWYVGYGMQGYESRRHISNRALTPSPIRLEGDYQGDSFLSTVELSRPFCWRLGTIRPILAMDILTASQGGHTESGDSLLAGDFSRVRFGRAMVRLGARMDLVQNDYTSLYYQMFYAVKFAGEDAPETKFRFVGAPEMSTMRVRGSDPGGGYLSLGFGNRWNLNKRKTRQLMAHYDLVVSERMCTNTGSLGFVQLF